MKIPGKILSYIGEKSGYKDIMDLSRASVYLFDDIVLKVQKNSAESDNEYNMMHWLNRKLPVPQIIEYAKTNKYSY